MVSPRKFIPSKYTRYTVKLVLGLPKLKTTVCPLSFLVQVCWTAVVLPANFPWCVSWDVSGGAPLPGRPETTPLYGTTREGVSRHAHTQVWSRGCSQWLICLVNSDNKRDLNLLTALMLLLKTGSNFGDFRFLFLWYSFWRFATKLTKFNTT